MGSLMEGPLSLRTLYLLPLSVDESLMVILHLTVYSNLKCEFSVS